MSSDPNVLQGPRLRESVSEESLGVQLHRALKEQDPAKVLLVDDATDETVTRGELLLSTCRLGYCLSRCGLLVSSNEEDDVIAICSENNLDFFQPMVAAFYQGICLTPINPSYTERELLHVLQISKPKLVFCSNATYPKFLHVRQLTPFVRRLVVFDLREEDEKVEDYACFVRENSKGFELRNFQAVDTSEDLAAIFSSSGTTGLPKGVMTTHKNFSHTLALLSDERMYFINPDACLFGILPFFHIYGFIVALWTIINGQKLVVVEKFVDRRFLAAIQKHRVSALWVVPPLLVFLAKSSLVLEYDLSSVQEIYSGAAGVGRDIQERIGKLFKLDVVGQGYGMTETTYGVLLTPKHFSKHGSCGKLVVGISGKVRDPGSKRSLGANETGELCFKGGLIMKGYYGDEAATRNAFDDEGFLLTGDLGYYDEEGFFFVVDRLKELIKHNGYQVAPAEVEAVLLSNPLIKDAGVVGLPDANAGELPLAFVVRQDGTKITGEEVEAFVAGQLSPHKHLRGGVRFLEEIPKNPGGKILRRVLREMAAKKLSKL